jgi:type IV pilus assembly protein PilY1
VHSAPTYFNGTVYVGANDGMLHAFDAGTGVEKFAYVPNLVYDHLAELADPDYAHNYYVDNTATVVDVNGQHVLVGALGKGGKGYFALDVTDPDSMDASSFLWEFPSGTDDDMGYSFSQANIVKTKASGAEYVVIFGNGYDSVNGSAVLYILNALTGAEIASFDTKVTGCNGLSVPAVADVDLDGFADYIYAGDLKGNLWKIDISSASTGDWGFAYGSSASPAPLITVKNSSGGTQPITSAPEVMLDCLALNEARGLMVMFGTGQYLNKADLDDHTVQSVYGVWDWGPVWEKFEGAATAKTKSLGTFQADRNLSNTASILLQQEFTNETDLWWTMTDRKPVWYNPKTDTGLHVGWYFDLPESDEGERIVQTPLLRLGSLVLVSTIPSSSPCDAGGRSSMYIVSPCTGGDTGRPEFDVNEDGKVTEDDVVTEITGSPTPQGKKSDAILYGPLEIDEILYPVDPDGNIPPVTVRDIPEGMYYWRVLGD